MRHLTKIDYSYNIRGWLKGINNIDNLTPASTENDLFAFSINYNNTIENTINGSVKPLYNGNIAETSWRTSSDNIMRRYGYVYDNLSRLSNSWYQKPDDAVPVTSSYNESLTYDLNGNIATLQRNGDMDDATTTMQIDNLSYAYPAGSNRLTSVTDSTPSPKGFKDYDDSLHIDYTYDANGNMLTDKNKGITGITYNHLNLPTEIVFDNSAPKKINYLYNAGGAKVKKTVTEGSIVMEVDYLGGYQYKDGQLSFFPTAEGYVNITRSKTLVVYNYVFSTKII